ncbi:MAG: tetratricopeptide repeat protein, partial [Nostoc sp.]
MLTNLKFIYIKQQDLEKTLGAIERILLLFPGLTVEFRDRGLIYYQLGYYPQAVDDLQNYLAKVPDAEDASVIRQLLTKLGKNS